MKVAILCLALCGAADPQVVTTQQRETWLYVTTSPAGAEVFVDDKRVGKTDDVFRVKPGVRRVIVKLEGHGRQGQDVTIRVGEIKRLKLRFRRQTKAALGPDTTAASILARLKNPPEGWEVLEASTASPDELEEANKELDGRLTQESRIVLSGHGKRMRVRVFEFTTSEDAEMAGKGIPSLYMMLGVSPDYYFTLGKTLVMFCEVDHQFAAKAAAELGFKAEPPPELADLLRQHELRKQNCVWLVVGKDTMTFEGEPTTWEELPELLEEVPDRQNTVLKISRTEEEWVINEWNYALGQAQGLAKRTGFKSTSFIGEHPLGARWRLSVRLVIAGEDNMTLEGRTTKKAELAEVLKSVPDRYRTVLQICRASGAGDKMTIKQWNRVWFSSRTLAHALGFKGETFIGEYPLGSKAEKRGQNDLSR